jgi:predicted lipoprotein with Yx(FWY)xxD motif/plastocyanin
MKEFRLVKRLLALAIIVAVVLVLGACSSAPAYPPAPASTSAAASTPATVATTTPAYTVKTASKTGIGDYLVDSKGMALYYFTKDLIGKSSATGSVLAAWPIFNPAGFVLPPSLNAADFGTITREDGLKQATYKGWPLYYFAKDQASGDTNGEAVGGIWFLIKSPFYTVMLLTKTDIGNYLVDARGMTLYYFTKDSVGRSTATADILKNWPIFNPSNFVILSTLSSADFGIITREDGLKQATYKGWPLYYFAKDQASGDTLGQGVNNVWYAIDPAKFPSQPSSAVSTPSPAPSPAPSSASPAASATGPSVTIDLVSQSMAFDKSSITVKAGASVTMNFNNKDGGIPHNFALYTNSSATTPIFVGQTIRGPATITYTFTAPATAGTYFFRCDIHPTSMTGTFVVTAQ